MVIIHLDANRRQTAREGPMPAREDAFLIHWDELCHNLAGREGRGAKHLTIIIIIHLGEHSQNCKGGQDACLGGHFFIYEDELCHNTS
jgi:hypothetical protein